MEKYSNALIHESSPYLLQHAHNPVNWIAWSDDVFELAKKEDKLVIISIGYSACHWCHVMEHECFEDEEVAAIMNKFFINIKVDREERPDVDQVYMTAVQLMTQRGGWPLNCITLADGRPIYGGTYFPKEQWINVLKSLVRASREEKDKVLEYASKLHDGIVNSDLFDEPVIETKFTTSKLNELVQRWSKGFDIYEGGNSKAPKFPLPNNYEFLIEYGIWTKSSKVLKHVELTLDKMAMGGIYDQIGGGFSRYAVDMLWKVPHFEKMLYDNGQLVSLYSKAYKHIRKPLYKRIVYQTIDWLEREMTDVTGAFYSAQDADSEGVEGKCYVWSVNELKAILGKDFEWVKELYEVNKNGHWEDGNYILLRKVSDRSFQKLKGWDETFFESELRRVNDMLFSERKRRIQPATDDKSLTSWNAIMLKGLCDAYAVFKDDSFLKLALKNGMWLKNNQIKEDGSIWRNYKKGVSNIDAFLEDYAHVIDAYIALYRITLQENWLELAISLTKYTLANFHDNNSGMFYFTRKDTTLIARKMEINDNVIPSSNSVMARNLFYLSKYYNDLTLSDKSAQMLSNVYPNMELFGSGYSNWAMLLIHHVFGFYEFVVCGNDAKDYVQTLEQKGIPFSLIAGSLGKSVLPIFKHKKANEKTIIHVCTEGSCMMPVDSIDQAIDLFNATKSS